MFQRNNKANNKKTIMSTSTTTTNNGKKRNSLSTTQYKSKLALALSNRSDNTSKEKIGVTQRGEYKLLENLLSENDLPLTLNIKNFSSPNTSNNSDNNNTKTQQQLRYNGTATVHIVQNRSTLNCITPDGSEIELPINDGTTTVNFLSIDNTSMYSTLGEVRCRRKEKNINWFTATKSFTVDEKDQFYAGQIFSFAQSGLFSSFKRDRNVRGVTVYAYPSSRKYYLPLTTEGDFRKCDSPDVAQTVELGEMAKSDNFPHFISVQDVNVTMATSSGSLLKNLVGRNLFVKSKTDQKFVYVTKKFRGSLQIHSFPLSKNLFGKLVSARRPLDRLDNTEISIVLRSFEMSGKRDETGYCIKTYNEIGIIRLLEEIFLELNHFKKEGGVGCTAGTYTRLSTLKNIDRRSIQKRIIKTYLRSPNNNNNNNNNEQNETTTRRYLQSVDGKQNISGENNKNSSCCPDNDVTTDEENDIRRHNYVNSTLFGDDAAVRTRELVLEFDDGGYVIIPFAGSSPKISVEKTTTEQRRKRYKSSDNVAYNYQQQSFDSSSSESSFNEDQINNIYDETNADCENIISNSFESRNWDLFDDDDGEEIYNQLYDLTCDQHVYTYIDTEGLSSPSKDEHADPLEAVYDYSYQGQLGISPQSTPATRTMTTGRSNIKSMTTQEACDMLKVNLMQHHVAFFQQHRVDGAKLENMTERDFVEMNMTRFEAKKFSSYLNGWRPTEGRATDHATWLSKLAKDWTCRDVIQYLQHINMISLQRFTQRHSVDGFLLKQILNDSDVMESLVTQHSLVLKQTDISRLRNYVLEDEKPRFKYFT